MANMLDYPFLANSGETTEFWNKDKFITSVTEISKEDGLYKLGKVCEGFSIKINKIVNYNKGYIIDAKTSDDGIFFIVYMNSKHKIVAIYGD